MNAPVYLATIPMNKLPRTVFVTKWALARGITEHEVLEERIVGGSHGVTIKDACGFYPIADVWKPDWHSTREEAVRRANTMREAKLKSLSKQAKRLRQATF